MFDPKIAFTKWVDPTNPGSVLKDRSEFTMEEQEVIDSLNYSFGDEKKEGNLHELNGKQKNLSFMIGPMGVIPMDEQVYPGKQYNLWNFHTNFDIGTNLTKLIGETKGVEVLKVWTRYRGWIGIANLFKHEDVFSEIRKNLSGYYNQKSENKLYGRNAAIYCINSVLKEHFEFYSIYQAPDGCLLPVNGANQQEIADKEEKFKDFYAKANQQNEAGPQRKVRGKSKKRTPAKANIRDDKEEKVENGV